MKRISYGLLLLMIISATACKEKFALPKSVVNKNYLVVEGYIDSGNDSTFIRLSRTVTPDDSIGIKGEQGAAVAIEGENNELFYLNEIGPGLYATAPLPLNPSEKYRLNIATGNGKTYQSDYVEVKGTPPIDSVSWTREANGLQIYANTHDPENNTRYYGWEYFETWEFHSAYYSNWEYKNELMFPRNNPDLIYRCWQSYTSTNIIVGSSAKLTDDIIYKYPIVYIPDDSWKLQVRYSILLKQRALSRGAYEYLENMKKNSEQLGSIFDPQPSTSNGNIHCTNDQSETVIGYIYSSAMVEKRIFISHNDVPGWKYRLFCEEISIKNDPDSLRIAFGGNGYIPTIEQRNGPVIVRYNGASGSCVNCTLRGTNIRPDFW